MELSNDSSISYTHGPTKNEQEKYKKIKVLGEGSMGKVYLVQQTLQNNKLYVMKRINIGHLQPKQKQRALLEAQLHSIVNHENIIKFQEIYHTTKDKLCIIMEYAEGGDLDQMLKDLKDNKKFLSEEEILKYFAQICLGLREIHEKKIVHRDLKGANIFLSKDGKIKIGDFGISKAMEKTVMASKSFVGTPFYLSPEMVEGKPYSTKADIWALGVILYHMTALKLPFDANSLPVLALKILKGSYPLIPSNAYSKQLKNLISSMLQVDQRKRPSVNEILCKPILVKYLPKQFVMTVTPKIQMKFQIKAEKIKLATSKSKKQLKAQTEKLSQEDKKKKRQEQKLKREQERKKMREDIKNKRMTGGMVQKQGQNIIEQNQKAEPNASQSAKIPKKLPAKVIPKSIGSINKNMIQNKIEKQKSPEKAPVQKPWKNKNIIRQKKQIQVEILLPGQKRKSLPQIQQSPQPLLKSQDFDVQIFVQGQNLHTKNQAVYSPLTNYSNFSESAQNAVLLPQKADSSNSIQRIIQNKSYDVNNLQDVLANVQKAQFMVSNLHNPYEKNEIQLYQESEDFDNTINLPEYPKKEDSNVKKFQNNQSDIQNMKYITKITDTQNLQELRQILEDRLGQDGFIRAYNVVKEHFQQVSAKKNTQQNDTEDSQAYMFNRKVLRSKLNFLSQELFDRNIQLLYTISVMQDLEMMKNFDSDQEQIYSDEDLDEADHNLY